MLDLKELIYSKETESKYGFSNEELETLEKEITTNYPNFNRIYYLESFVGNTVTNHKGKTRFYHIDVYHAFLCGIENRGLKSSEFD